MGGSGEIMAGCGWWQQSYGWSWMVVGGGGEIMANRGWLWVVATKLWLVVGGCGWSWMVAQFSNAHCQQLRINFREID